VTSSGVGDREYYERWYAARDALDYRGLLAQIVREARPGPMLDVGAGLGFFVECAQRFGLDCQGLEGSPDAVDAGRARFAALRVRLHRLTAHDALPVASSSQETVVMNQVIEHLDEATGAATVREVFRVLRPGGLFFVFSPSAFNEAERRADPTHIHLYRPSALRALLVATGFADVRAVDDALAPEALAPNALLERSPALLRRLLATRGARSLTSRVFRATGFERMSATANCIARRP
jgi:SAM-dependent methyltransferase